MGNFPQRFLFIMDLSFTFVGRKSKNEGDSIRMLHSSLRNPFVKPGTLFYLLSGCLVCWLGAYLKSVGYPIYGEVSAPALWNMFCSRLPDKFVAYVIGFLLMIGGAFMIHRANYELMLIREKTLLPAFFYILLISTNLDFLPLKSTSFGVFFLILAIYYLFITYRNPGCQLNIFKASLVLALGSLLWTYILWFIPFLWYGMYKFRSLNLRTFLSSLLGIVVVLWFLFNYSLWRHDFSFFSVFDAIFKLRPLSISGNVFIDWLTIGTTMGLTLLSSVNIMAHEYEDNSRTRQFLSFLIVLAFSSFALYFLYEQSSEEFLQIACFPASILISHFFTIVRNKYTFWLFHVSVLLLIALLLFRLWNF